MTTTTNNAQPTPPLTAERLREMFENLPPVPADPLNGATTLYVHPDKADIANKVREASGGRVHVQISKLATPKVIAGFFGQECVCIIRLEED